MTTTRYISRFVIRSACYFLVLAMILGAILLIASCNRKTNELKDLDLPSVPTFDNDRLFTYDENTQLSISDFKTNITLSDLYRITKQKVVMRDNNEFIYTVYSLKDRHLCYVIIKEIPKTGFVFFVEKIIEYPFADEDKYILDYIFEKDYPENILK